MNKTIIPKAFLLLLLIFVTWACYLIFKPFLVEIIAAAILVSIFYTPYEWLANKLKGSNKTAALIMCLLVVLIVIVPIVNLIVYGAQQSVEAYGEVIKYVETNNVDNVIKDNVLARADLFGFNGESFKELIIDVTKGMSNWFASGAASFVKGTTGFVVSLILIVFTMFFFFVDGKKMVEKLMHWTPLSNKYDKEIFKKFRDVSFSTVISTFVTAIAQGLIGAVGFLIVGLPAFLPAVFMAFLSLIPYVGAAIVWLPAGIYLLFMGKIWQGVFMLVWGGVFVSNIDNLIRAYLIQGKAKVHPIFIIFSILGGIALFGFWGVIFGPLIISLAVTILHIYEMEYEEVLEK
jgi:predicted PurR-regulated permease PerM